MNLHVRRPCLLAVAIVVAVAGTVRAQESLSLGPLFQDHAVLQRDTPVTVWGTAGPGEEVTVACAGREGGARADASGRWMVVLPALPAGGPHSLEVRTTSGALRTIADILIGDVFLCSGQSNMEFGVAQSSGGEFVATGSTNDRIRLMTIARAGMPLPAASFEVQPEWQRAEPQSVRPFSATCYYFGREIHDSQQVPVGLVNASWGGTAIEPWISDAGLRALGGFDARLDLLTIYARDDDAGNQRFGQLWEAWWRKQGHDLGEPWRPDAPGSWTDVPALTDWKTWGVADLATHDGMVWFRRTFTLTPEQAAGAARLSLGAIDEVDQTWVNGHIIRNTFGWSTPRTYRLPAGSLRAGENVVVVNVLSTWDMGGLYGPADAIALTFDDGTRVPLGTGWRYRHVPLSVGRPPRAPWETIAGLTTVYNAMIAPIGRFAFRAVAWYQGESNTDDAATYGKLLGSLMASWRSQFGAALPFLVVQLPNFGPRPTSPTEATWADLRESQRRAVAADPHAALVVTIDLGEPADLHPGNKRDVGRRLARAARHIVYGEAISPSGPIPLSATRVPAGVVVTFGDVDGRLVTYSANVATGFELCGAGPASCRYVAGEVDGSRVTLPVAPRAGAPVRVRFCWGASPTCNLSDGSALPAGPFEIPIT